MGTFGVFWVKTLSDWYFSWISLAAFWKWKQENQLGGSYNKVHGDSSGLDHCGNSGTEIKLVSPYDLFVKPTVIAFKFNVGFRDKKGVKIDYSFWLE